MRLYNTLANKLEKFKPLNPECVRLYACGPTVYDAIHIGNGRMIVVFDTLYRLLRQIYGPSHVRYARNITDVDDKIIERAIQNGENIETLTERTIEIFHSNIAAMGCLAPDYEPRCTEYIPQMIAMIETLISGHYAYEAEGHVLFAVESYSEYGRLSNRSLDEMIAGARVEVAPYKRNSADFVLWKPSQIKQPGWESPWGRGRPGWHIECSAMAKDCLGESFDIHGGGLDLIFPHHENEIAQSCCANGTEFAHTWLHNGYLMSEGEKMSKSLGNFYTVNGLLNEGFSGETLRLALLSAHYRAPLDFSKTKLQEAKAQLDKLYGALEGFAIEEESIPPHPNIIEALKDDLNSPKALAQLHALASKVNSTQGAKKQALQAELCASGRLLGLLGQKSETWFRGMKKEGAIETLITERKAAKASKDFAKADQIRDDLKAKGIELLDHPDGSTQWRKE